MVLRTAGYQLANESIMGYCNVSKKPVEQFTGKPAHNKSKDLVGRALRYVNISKVETQGRQEALQQCISPDVNSVRNY